MASGGPGRGSPVPIAPIPSADRRKLTAFTTTVVTGPSIPMAAPPSGGPAAVAVHVVDSNLALARSRFPGSTSALRYAPLAAVNTTLAADATTETATSWARVSVPSA